MFRVPRCAIPQAAFGRRPVIDRGILPERAKLVDDGNAETASDSQCRQRIQHGNERGGRPGGMSRPVLDAAGGGCHFLQENDARCLREPVRPHRIACCAVSMSSGHGPDATRVDASQRRHAAHESNDFSPKATHAVRVQIVNGTTGECAWRRHAASWSSPTSADPSTTLRRKASNMRSVHNEEL